MRAIGVSVKALLQRRNQHDHTNETAAWILGHVLSGWDGTNALVNPTDLCKWSQFSLIPQLMMLR